MHLVITREVVIGCFVQGLAQLQIAAAKVIAYQDAVAPATPSTTAGLKVKYYDNFLILKRMFIRKYFNVKYFL